MPLLKARGTPTPFYPLSPGKTLNADATNAFVAETRASLAALDADPGLDADAKSRLRKVAGVLDHGSVAQVSCAVAKREHFTAAKKRALHAENLSPWEQVFPASGAADWSTATECYRSYFEPEMGDGFAVYGAKAGAQTVLLEVWIVREVV